MIFGTVGLYLVSISVMFLCAVWKEDIAARKEQTEATKWLIQRTSADADALRAAITVLERMHQPGENE